MSRRIHQFQAIYLLGLFWLSLNRHFAFSSSVTVCKLSLIHCTIFDTLNNFVKHATGTQLIRVIISNPCLFLLFIHNLTRLTNPTTWIIINETHPKAIQALRFES